MYTLKTRKRMYTFQRCEPWEEVHVMLGIIKQLWPQAIVLMYSTRTKHAGRCLSHEL